jgi:smad nuclear-interacting protein 1
LGREERVVDVVTAHPSCSGQHATLQFRCMMRKGETEEEWKLTENKDKGCVSLFLIDLDSTNSTSLNGERIESSRYVKIRHKDIIKFGGSKRDYILILPPN